ncbi:DUF378 domain-containing protein [Candidatus Woesearchaeota archaeon]|nr:DUF378 domain-containing protein [Candidatus Woesearchaeota archaeon]
MAGTEQINQVADWLVLIGALNWGLAGVGNFIGPNLNVVDIALGSFADGAVANVVYVLVGLSALWVLKGKFMK